MSTSDEDDGNRVALQSAEEPPEPSGEQQKPTGERGLAAATVGDVDDQPPGGSGSVGRDGTAASALETVEFVARSENRLRTLEVLAEGPRTRSDLPGAVGASRVTLRRILLDFEERGWVSSEGRTYAMTPLGRMVVEAFEALLATTTAVDDLRPVMPWFPADALDVDLAWLADADVATPGPGDPYAPLRRLTDAVRGATSVSLLTSQVTGWCDERVVRRVEEGSLSLDLVLGRDAMAALRGDPGMGGLAARVAAAGNAATWLADDDVPVVAVVDGRAWILVTDGEGSVRGLVTSGDERVVERAGAAVDRHRGDARALVPELFEQ